MTTGSKELVEAVDDDNAAVTLGILGILGGRARRLLQQQLHHLLRQPAVRQKLHEPRLPQLLLLRRPLAPRPQQRVEPRRLRLQCAEDPQRSDDGVDQHGGPAPDGLLEGEVDGAVRERRQGEAEGARGRARRHVRDEAGGGFCRGEEEEDVVRRTRAVKSSLGRTKQVIEVDTPCSASSSAKGRGEG
jgi:hypothetical protein